MTPDASATRPTTAYRALPHALALLAAAFTWPLLMVGGTVSVYRVGMAVPDWPTTFGFNMFAYNMFESSWGVFAEHSHRLYASLVGFACLGLAGFFSVTRRGWRGLIWFSAAVCAAAVAAVNPPGTVLGLSRFLAGLACLAAFSLAVAVWNGLVRRDAILGLAWLALASVAAQGALGGSRVTQNSTWLAFLHGCFAYAVFGLLAALCVITGRRWIERAEAPDDIHRLRRLGLLTLGLVALQIVAGTYVRHYGSGEAVGLHAALAVAVVAHVGMLTRRVGRAADARTRLARPAYWMAAWAGVQLVLGVLAWWVLRPFDGIPRPVSGPQALVRVAHQGVAALLLAASLAMVMHAFRLRGRPVDVPVRDALRPTRALEVAV
jgi:cytochrome c oxidase assembly protein subunit 15